MDLPNGVGIFQAHWPLQIHTINLARALGQAGFAVDLFLHSVDSLYDLCEAPTWPNVRIYWLPAAGGDDTTPQPFAAAAARPQRAAPNIVRPWRRLARRLKATVLLLRDRWRLWRQSEQDLPPTEVLRQSRKLMHDRQYCCLIGVEKTGLVWAGRLAAIDQIPIIYYSLELYTWDDPVVTSSWAARRLKLAEVRHHRRAVATIIQDKRRAAVLFRDHQLDPPITALYLPVSLNHIGGLVRTDFLQARLHLSPEQTLILQFGYITPIRWSLDLARIAQGFPADWALVLHGPATPDCAATIRRIDNAGRVIVSTDHLPSDLLPTLVASAHIGLVLYRATPVNDYLTAFASEKLALYLQCGLPVIAFRYPGYELLEAQRCGVLVDAIDDLPQAIATILAHYAEFSDNARMCFAEYYEFSKNVAGVLDYVRQLQSRAAANGPGLAKDD